MQYGNKIKNKNNYNVCTVQHRRKFWFVFKVVGAIRYSESYRLQTAWKLELHMGMMLMKVSKYLQ